MAEGLITDKDVLASWICRIRANNSDLLYRIHKSIIAG